MPPHHLAATLQEFFMQKMRLSLELLPNQFNCELWGVLAT